jgi:hypothetical protein
MTPLGKVVMGIVGLFIAGSIFYGVTSFMKQDSEVATMTPVTSQATTSQEEIQATSTASTTPALPTASAQSTSTEKVSKKIPFGEFMSKGGSYKCAITQKMANMISEGTVYMHDKLVRVEFATNLAGQSISTTMVARDGYMYSWTSTTPGKGYKMKVGGESGKTATTSTYTWNGSQVGEYTCSPWIADDSLFELPKTVVFTTQ